MKYRIYLIFLLTTVLLPASGCSEHSLPDSPEPTLHLEEASGITRTEATMTASIDRHGGPGLTFVSLRYGEALVYPDMMETLEADPSLTDFQFHLSGLLPGTEYSCRLEAGTATARMASAPISFTTISNDPPKVSAITPLSTGPLGILVRFSILDDGGEHLAEAGCEVKQEGSTEARRIYISDLSPSQEYLQLNITGLSTSNSYAITPFASNSIGETRGESFVYTTSPAVILHEPGHLAALFADSDGTLPDRLTIAGPMDGDDFRTLRSMLGAPAEGYVGISVADIDLSDVMITEGGRSYDGQRFTAADRLSTGIFADCCLLRHAILPNSAIAVDRDAFARCAALETITMPASAETILPSSECQSLRDIEIPPANTLFIASDGVLLDGDGSRIIWFPCGKTGEYKFPASITSIGENAFAGTSITSLIIPGSVTSISRGAFAGSALEEIRLPDNISNISEGMFQNCEALTTVRLGYEVSYIGDYAFDGTDLADLYIAADYPPYAAPEAFANRRKSITEECTLHVPAGTRTLFRSHSKWGIFTKIEEFQP